MVIFTGQRQRTWAVLKRKDAFLHLSLFSLAPTKDANYPFLLLKLVKTQI